MRLGGGDKKIVQEKREVLQFSRRTTSWTGSHSKKLCSQQRRESHDGGDGDADMTTRQRCRPKTEGGFSNGNEERRERRDATAEEEMWTTRGVIYIKEIERVDEGSRSEGEHRSRAGQAGTSGIVNTQND